MNEPDRRRLSQTFLSKAGWGAAERRFLAGDASDRRYDRLKRGGMTAVLMDAPPGKADDSVAFIAIDRHLRSLGLSAPRIFAEDLTAGFLLLEDLGDGLYARLLESDLRSEAELYAAATDVLLHVQSHPAPANLINLSAADWSEAASLALGWYGFAAGGAERSAENFCSTLTHLLQDHADGTRVLILRDYHAENLLWLPERHGLARVGLLDFQLAQMGQPGYDLVSLLQDARRDVPEALEREMIRRFVAATRVPEAEFSTGYAVLGAQRALRILGIFARLCLRDGKPQYVALIPRVWRQLQRNLAHPALESLAKVCTETLPEPTPAFLERIRAQCATYPTR